MKKDAKVPDEQAAGKGPTSKVVLPPRSTGRLIHQIKRLRRSYSIRDVAVKLGLSESTVKGLLVLERAGAEELLEAAVNGTVPLDLALEIARDRPPETRRKLRHLRETKKSDVARVRAAAQSVSRTNGGQTAAPDCQPRRGQITVRQMIEAYQRESRRQKELIRKARACEERLAFVVAAFNQLLACGPFLELLKAEELATMPEPLWARLNHQPKEAA
jgi:ParB family chromosome partitioning protein